MKCGGGASQVKSGTTQNVVFSAGLITEGLGLVSPWLLPFAILIDAFVWQALSNCGTDPPAMPTPAQLSPVNAIGGVFNPNFAAWRTAVNDLLLNWAWELYCECAAGAPTAAIYPAAPAGVSAPSPTGGQPCFVGTYGGLATSDTSPQPTQRPANVALEPSGPSATVTFGVLQIGHFRAVPAGVYKSIDLAGTVTFDPLGSKQFAMEVTYLDGTQTLISTPGSGVLWQNATVPFSASFAVPSNAEWIMVETAVVDETHVPTIQVTATWSCSATTSVEPCAPCTDPATQQLLNTLLHLTEAIWTKLETPATTYLEGTVHAGLTGAGTVTLAAGTVAVRINITTDTTGFRIDAGTPPYLFSRGYIVPIAAEGPIRRTHRLVYNPQVYQLPDLTEQLGYTLPPGITISVTELHT